MQIFLLSFLLACATLTFSACDNTLISSPDQVVFPDSAVSYQRHVQPLFNLTCAFSGCHSDDSRAGNLCLTSYLCLFQKTGLVLAGKPESSLLAQIIDVSQVARPYHPPSFQARINTNHIDGIKRWIKEGAKNN